MPLSVIKLEMSPDLKIAYVYVSSYEKISNEEVLDRIEQSKDFIAKEVVKLIESQDSSSKCLKGTGFYDDLLKCTRNQIE